MGRVTLLLVLLANFANADPQLIPLNTLSSAFTYTAKSVEPEAQVYLASSDDNSVLKNIVITTGATSITLDTINDYNDNGTPKYFTLVGDLQISTTNDKPTIANMTGNLYVTTRTQAKDPNFSVYVIKDQHTIRTNAMKSTAVVLNTWLPDFVDADTPRKISYVSQQNQAPNTNIYFQWGIPPSNWYEVTNNTFFTNPIVVLDLYGNKTQVFFDNVEPLQIGLDAWYFMVYGPNNMRVEKKYVSNHNYTTTATMTTGLVMNSGIYQEHVVNFMPDVTKNGTSGVEYVAFGEYETIGVYLQTATGGLGAVMNNSHNSNDKWGFSTDDQAYMLKVNATSNTPGTFFAQYFTYPGMKKPVSTTTVMPTTTPPVTEGAAVSTTTVGTSTKGTGYGFAIEVVMMLILGIRLL